MAAVGTVVAADRDRIAVDSPGVDMAAGSGRVLALKETCYTLVTSACKLLQKLPYN